MKHAYNFRDLTGQTFGRLLVKELSPKRDKHRYTVWICECLCGNPKPIPVSSTNLIGGNTKSCGCLRREQKLSQKRPFESTYNALVRRAGDREIGVELTYEEFLRFTTVNQCHYCDGTVQWFPYRNRQRGGGAPYNLDRRVNTEGYKVSNLVVCCARCNYGKGDRFTYEEWAIMTSALRGWRWVQGASA